MNNTLPQSTTHKRAILAIGLTCLLGWLFAYLSIYVFKDYAFGLFVWLPLVMGLTSTVLYGYKNPTANRELRNISFLSLFIFCTGLLFMALEGIICLVMAAPIGLFFNWAGYRVGRTILSDIQSVKPPTLLLVFILSVPALMAFEDDFHLQDELRSVTTVVEIEAAPEEVWKNVVAFPPLDEPTELIFQAGIAYPIHASIAGQGVGAIRHCNFSTGSFVEPITHWKEPYLLQFDVTDQPEPMRELSLYDIHPNHLHGYWVSQKGQFQLTRLENGNTRLEGTTWYINRIKPGLYWTLWSDFIVHKIHERVLEHIKKVSEQ